METRNRWMVGLGLVALALGCEGSDLGSNAPELIVDQADAQSMAAHLIYQGEKIDIRSSTTHTNPATAQDDDGTPLQVPGFDERSTTVTGASGTVYAVWNTRVDSGFVSGTYGTQTFGGAADETTDADGAVWRPIVQSPVGDVLKAVSGAAQAETSIDATQVPALEDIQKMSDDLAGLAQDPASQAYNGCAVRYTDRYLYHFGMNGEYKSGAGVHRPQAGCTRGYSVILATGGGTLLDSCSTQTANDVNAACYANTYWNEKNYVCRKAMIWDSKSPSTKISLHRCDTADWCVGNWCSGRVI